MGVLDAVVVAAELAMGERMMAASERSPANPPPPEITNRLSALLWRGPTGTARINWEVKPWGEVKSKRGRKKKYVTQGYMCLNPACAYFGHTDEHIQALVRHTTRGKDKDIPYLCCQACQTVFTSRKEAPLYTLKAKPGQVEMELWFLVDGVDMAVMVRYTGRAEAAIARWLERMGTHSQGWHNVLFRALTLSLVQMDELYARVKNSEQARWLWLVIDPVTKVIPTLHLGGRKNEDAYAVAHDLKERVAAECVPSFMTDGLWMYFYALTAHFGRWFRPPRARTDHWQPDKDFRHVQLVKRTHRRRLTDTIRRMAWGKRSALFDVLAANGFRQTIQTAFIERLNLTFRQGVAGLARQTLGFSLGTALAAVKNEVRCPQITGIKCPVSPVEKSPDRNT